MTAIVREGPLDILDPRAVRQGLQQERPDELYYLAAFHHSSEDRPPGDRQLYERSHAVHVSGLLHCLDAIADLGLSTRVFYAASAHIFGDAPQERIDESTPFAPQNVYGITKASGARLCQLYRQRHGVFACVGYLFNHESPLRPERFLSRKLVEGARRIAAEQAGSLTLGDLDAAVDWGWAPDSVRAMRLILASPQADDYVVATGVLHSVRDFAQRVFAAFDLAWQDHVRVQQGLVTSGRRPQFGDASKLRAHTGWAPSLSFEQMVSRLVRGDLE